MELPASEVKRFMHKAYGYFAKGTAHISRYALASGSCDHCKNRGQRPAANDYPGTRSAKKRA